MFRRRIETETTIEGTPSEVWAVLTDFASYGEWNLGMTSVEGQAEAGTRLNIRFRLKGDRTMKMRPTVLVSEPERELRWLGRLILPGIFDGEHSFELHDLGHGEVRFVQAERFRGVLIPFLRNLIEIDTLSAFERMNGALAERVAELRAAAGDRG